MIAEKRLIVWETKRLSRTLTSILQKWDSSSVIINLKMKTSIVLADRRYRKNKYLKHSEEVKAEEFLSY